ncbi:hypothetical protein ACU4HD_06720 [Cupriavidus basilensis]
MLRDPRVWRYCAALLGGVRRLSLGLSLWMTKYYIGEYGFDIKIAALLAAISFSLPGGVLRAIGGWISDRYGAHRTTWWVMWVCWVAFFLLSYPQTDVHHPHGARPASASISACRRCRSPRCSLSSALPWRWARPRCSSSSPTISATTSAPSPAWWDWPAAWAASSCRVLFGLLADLTGVRSSCFMLLYGTVCVSLVWMHYSQRGKGAGAGQRVLAAQPA